MARWALDQGYDYMVKLDDDVVIDPEKFVGLDFVGHDFSGHSRARLGIPQGLCYFNRAG
jgi:hypothetical protein